MNTGGGNGMSLIRVLPVFQDPQSVADFLEFAFDAVVIFDPQERIAYWNPAAEQMFGWTAQEALGKTPLELFWLGSTPQEKKKSRERLASLNRGVTLRGENHACRKDGSSLWVQYTTQAILDENRKITGYLNLFRDISVHVLLREKEEELKQSNTKLNEILESIQDDFYVLDRDWNFVYTSRSFTSKLGKEPEDLIGNNIWEMFPKHVGTKFEKTLREAMEKREVGSLEFPGKYTNAWYRIKAFPSAEGITVLGTDITEQRRAQQAVIESRRKYQHLIETTSDFIWEMDSQGRYTYCSPQMKKLWGLEPQDMIGKTPFDVMPPDEKDRALEAFKEVATLGAPFYGQTTAAFNSQGQLIFIETSGVPFFNQDGGLLGFRGITRDITERKRAEEQLRELSQRLTYHVDNSPLAVIEWGPDMRLIRWSGAAERIFGWQAGEVLGKRMEDFHWIYDEDRSQVGDVSVDLQSGRDSKRFSANRNYRKDGSVAYCEWYNSSLVDDSGNLHSILSLVLDVTERKQATDALHESEKELQLLNQSLEQKVKEKTAQVRRLASELVKAEQRERSRISHILHDDLQQRIYALQMELTVLRDMLEPEHETARKEVFDIERQMNEIRQVIRHLSIELSPPILPDEGLSHAMNWLAAHMQQQHGLPIEVAADGPFAIADEQIHVLLFNCVRELLFNVVKHAQASHAVVSLRRSDDNLQIEVRDDGRGFPVHRENGGMNGAALPSSFGIPTIRHQLSLFGGSMRIDSEPGAGTRIVLNVPLGQAI